MSACVDAVNTLYDEAYSNGETIGYDNGVNKISGKSTGDFTFFLTGWTSYGGVQSAQATVNYSASYSNGTLILSDSKGVASKIYIKI